MRAELREVLIILCYAAALLGFISLMAVGLDGIMSEVMTARC